MPEPQTQRLTIGRHVIELETVCPHCQGQGHSLDHVRNMVQPCQPCQGRGRMLTQNGHAILMMIKDYGKLYGAV